MTTEYIIQGDYGFGHGWEDLVAEESKEEAQERLREYNENEPQYPHRMVARPDGSEG